MLLPVVGLKANDLVSENMERATGNRTRDVSLGRAQRKSTATSFRALLFELSGAALMLAAFHVQGQGWKFERAGKLAAHSNYWNDLNVWNHWNPSVAHSPVEQAKQRQALERMEHTREFSRNLLLARRGADRWR